jgi:hypothetical protein
MNASCQRLMLVACLGGILPIAQAQDGAAQAADREAAEERYQRLNSAVEGLWAAQADQQRRLEALVEELRRVRAEQASKPAVDYATREELNRLVEGVRELDRKREADRQLILEELERLGKSLAALNAARERRPAPAPAPAPGPAPGSEREGGATGSTQEGVYYVIERGNTLSAIVAAHNDEFKKQGKKTSVKLVQEANPNIKPTVLLPGQKIFIPLVPE